MLPDNDPKESALDTLILEMIDQAEIAMQHEKLNDTNHLLRQANIMYFYRDYDDKIERRINDVMFEYIRKTS